MNSLDSLVSIGLRKSIDSEFGILVIYKSKELDFLL